MAMITLLRDDEPGVTNDLDPVLGIAASVLVSCSLYGVIGAVIAYLVLR